MEWRTRRALCLQQRHHPKVRHKRLVLLLHLDRRDQARLAESRQHVMSDCGLVNSEPSPELPRSDRHTACPVSRLRQEDHRGQAHDVFLTSKPRMSQKSLDRSTQRDPHVGPEL
jgi:hypothetical protein